MRSWFSVHRSPFTVYCLLSVLCLCTPCSAGVTTRVSVASDGTQMSGNSDRPSISADGRYVAFCYSWGGAESIFVHDRQTGQTTRVSVATDGTQANGKSYTPSISADGRYVAFASYASNLVSGDTNGYGDVFVRDRQTGVTERVSVASDGTQGNGTYYGSDTPSISSDGRYVAFESDASNLVPGDTNGYWYYGLWLGNVDVFVHDRHTKLTERVSVASDGTQGNDSSSYPSISADGRYVAFSSGASTLVPGDTNGCYDVFVHDRQTGQTMRVSVASDGTQGNASSGVYCGPSLSADGRYVAFESEASNLVPGDTNWSTDAFVHDRQTGVTERASVASDGNHGGQGRGQYAFACISADGRYVAFDSTVTNLVPGDTNGQYDVFLHDRQTGQTTRVSVASDGTQGNSGSGYQGYAISISADGRYVAFVSFADNLVPVDSNGDRDVFVHDRGAGSTPGGASISEFALTPGTLAVGTSVTARLTGTGIARARVRIEGLGHDQPAINMTWDGSAWVGTIGGSLSRWARGESLAIWADAYDASGASVSVCKSLAVQKSVSPPPGAGNPNAVSLDDSDSCGVLTGEPTILNEGPPLKARLSMTTNMTSWVFGIDGPMAIWPGVTCSGVPMQPSADEWSLGHVLAGFKLGADGRFSPSGGPTYDADFSALEPQAHFVAKLDALSFGLMTLDVADHAAAVLIPGMPDLSPANTLDFVDKFILLSPVKDALKHFQPWPTVAQLPKATFLAACDLSKFVWDDVEKASFRTLLEAVLRQAKHDPGLELSGECLKAANVVLSYWALVKINRDMWVWGTSTDLSPSLTFEAYRSTSGQPAVRALTSGGSEGLVRGSGTAITYQLAEAGGQTTYNFTLGNTKGSPLWEWRIQLDEDQPSPISVAGPTGWKSEIVTDFPDRYVRWYTEGTGGWSSGDFGTGTIEQGSSLSGFSIVMPSRLEQVGFSASDTDLRIDGGMLAMVPGLFAIPPEFAPTEGESTTLQAYLDRPATVAMKIYSGGSEYKTISGSENKSTGAFEVNWDGLGSDGNPAASGDYEARLLINYADGDTAELPTPLTVDTGVYVYRIGDLRSVPIGTGVRASGIVTVAPFGSPSSIYVEGQDRAAGILVQTPDGVVEGDTVRIVGMMSEIGPERAITAARATVLSTGGSAPKPLAMPSRTLGGGSVGLVPGCLPSLSNIGLLVNAWGRVTQVGDGYLYVDDGSALRDGTVTGAEENIGVRVICDPADYDTGDYLIVTGISSCFETPSAQLARRILVRRPEDIQEIP